MKTEVRVFTKAIVRKPCKNMLNGITSADLGLPEYEKALVQHQEYINALKKCGLEVIELEEDENYPDSTFVEDAALLTKQCAIITNPGAESRRGETSSIENVVKDYFEVVEKINFPGTLEAGDVMMVGNHFYIGLSGRTNLNGAEQLISILDKHGMSGSVVKLAKVLHLKTGVNYLENNNLLVCGEFVDHQDFQNFNLIEVPEKESYAANSLWINDTVLVPKEFPITKQKIIDVGYSVIEVDLSEFQKLDGGLSCLSLRF